MVGEAHPTSIIRAPPQSPKSPKLRISLFVMMRTVDPKLDYFTPALDSLPVPPGPPDPPIPAGLLAPPSHRRLAPKPTNWLQLIIGILVVSLLVIALPGYALFEIGVFSFVPTTPGKIVSARIRTSSKGRRNNEITFSYQDVGIGQTDTEEVSDGFYAAAKSNQPIGVHALKIGQWHYATMDLSWGDFAIGRYWRWLISAAVLGFILVSIRRSLNPTPIEQTLYGQLALSGVPMIARLIKKGSGSFTLSNGKSTYQYILPNGRAVKTTVDYRTVPCLSRRRPGDPLIVICDPREKEFHVLYDALPFTVELK